MIGLETPFGMSESLGAIVCDDDSLAPGQTIVLDHVWWPELVKGSRDGIGIVARTGGCRRHTGSSHHFLGESLRPFQLGGLGTWTEAVDPGLAQSIGHPGNQRRLRADDDEVSFQATRQGDNGITIARIQRMIRGEGCRPRVTGSDVDGGNLWVTMAGQGKGMLAATGPKDENSHAGHGD